MKKGMVYLIGAGPGDPGLFTLRGRDCLAAADVVIYDHLVHPDILRHIRPGAEVAYAGKQGGSHSLSQDEINDRLVQAARRGKTVARLKGGDPFVFGRGGEEALVLARAGIPFVVVPGVTSAVAVPAYAGIPLTQRGYTSTLALVAGHEDPTKMASDISWDALARLGTVVFLMGVKNLPRIAENLIRHGRSAETPAALIRWGTTPGQKTLQASLGEIAARAEAERFTPPAVFVVGEVVALREALTWFETKPLFNRGVIVTRPEAQAEEMAALLWAQGARPLRFPVIATAPPPSWDGLDRACAAVDRYAWIVFTSANGVRFFFDRFCRGDRDVRDLKGVRIATIGPATARAVAERGLRVDLVPESFVSEGVVAAFQSRDLRGRRVLLPRAAEARDVLPEGLRGLGAEVDAVTAYQTVSTGRTRQELDDLLRTAGADVVSFTSPSTVREFCAVAGRNHPLWERIVVACLGPVTVAEARRLGLPVHIVQERFTVPGLVDAMVRHFQEEGP